MNISNNGLELLKRIEGHVKIGNRHIIYDDQTGKPVQVGMPYPRGATIGYGHLIQPGENFVDGISEAYATELLHTDIATAEHAVRRNIAVKLNQNQYDALVIFAYNIGVNNFAKSTVVKYINNPAFHSVKYPTLESAWMAWTKSNSREMAGLRQRRMREWKLFCAI